MLTCVHTHLNVHTRTHTCTHVFTYSTLFLIKEMQVKTTAHLLVYNFKKLIVPVAAKGVNNRKCHSLTTGVWGRAVTAEGSWTDAWKGSTDPSDDPAIPHLHELGQKLHKNLCGNVYSHLSRQPSASPWLGTHRNSVHTTLFNDKIKQTA